MSQIYSIVQYYGVQRSNKCGYCKTTVGHESHGMWLHYLNPNDYQNLIDRGWRRSGNYGYKPILQNACCPLYTIRCSACDLKLSRSQKKVIKRFNRFINHGDRKKSYMKEKEVFRESMETSPQSCVPTKDIERVVGTFTQKSEKISLPSASSDTDHKLPESSLSSKPSSDVKSSNQNPKKKKTIRMERAKHKIMAKGVPEEQAIDILKAKKKYPKEKTLEEFLSECEKPNNAHKFEVKVVQSSPVNDMFEKTFATEYEVYRKYQIAIHKDKPAKCTEDQFRRFLVSSPLEPQPIGVDNAPIKYFGSYHQQYWLDEKLIAVGVIDILPACLSSVYFFYDPEYQDLILGTYGSMREVQLVRQLQQFIPSLRYYYMGFYIHSCPKMRYKARIGPSDLLCPETFTWHSISSCLEKMEKYGGCRLNDDPSAKDENSIANYENVLMLRSGKILRCGELKREFRSEDTDEIKEYAKSVGKKCAYSMLLFRG